MGHSFSDFKHGGQKIPRLCSSFGQLVSVVDSGWQANPEVAKISGLNLLCGIFQPLDDIFSGHTHTPVNIST
jgi:hypothetical protein